MVLLQKFLSALLGTTCFIYRHELCKPDPRYPLLLDATLDELRAGLDAGHFSSVDLVQAYIARIQQVNGLLHAVTEINPDALQIAAQIDDVRRASRSVSVSVSETSPLLGIPVLLKDNIATADRMNNTAGSYALLGATVPEDSTVAAKLRSAGAIILGKANLSQWAGMRSSNSSQGWSAYGGQTVGAYFPGMDPDGSSSGSAVASSIGLTWASLGTDTGGSISDPSHKNNIVGIRPTLGLVSRHLVVPISLHQDTVGPMARTVKDAAYLLQVIAGPDRKDNFTRAAPNSGRDQAVPDYVAACKLSGLEGKRLGVPRDMRLWWFDKTTPPVFSAMREIIAELRAAGAQVIEDIEMPGVESLAHKDVSRVVAADGFVDDLPRYLEQLTTNPNNITSVADLQRFTRDSSVEEYPEKNTQAWDRLLENPSSDWWAAYTTQRYYAGDMGLTGALTNHSLDALIMPAPLVSRLAAPIGAPVVTVPYGKSPAWTPVILNDAGNLNITAPNQPFGIAFAGAPFHEETLIEIAYAFEQRTKARKAVAPYVQPRTELRHVLRRGFWRSGFERLQL